jgi:hypothetical protein
VQVVQVYQVHIQEVHYFMQLVVAVVHTTLDQLQDLEMHLAAQVLVVTEVHLLLVLQQVLLQTEVRVVVEMEKPKALRVVVLVVL